MLHTNETILPSDQDAHAAREISAALTSSANREGGAQLRINDEKSELTLPVSVVRLLLGVLQEIGKGNGVTITAIEKEFTTQQAADLLRVSRPFLIEELLDKGVLPFRKVGNRRRIRYDDLLRYKEAEEEEIARRKEAMLELMEETERLGLY